MSNDEQTVEIPLLDDGVVIERINKADLKPMYDTNHEHQYERDEEDTDDYYAEVCVVEGCNLGRLIAKA